MSANYGVFVSKMVNVTGKVNDMLETLIEQISNSEGPFLLEILLIRTWKQDGWVRDCTETETIFADKDQAVSRLFDLCELYNWKLVKINASCEFGSRYTVKWEVELRKEDKI